MNYRNLEAEMARKGWTRADLANVTGIPRATVVEWLRPGSATRILLVDALAIRNALAPEVPVEILFETDGEDGCDE